MGMKPGNPVVGGTILERAAIQSPNYVPGTAGWAVDQNGNAEFNSLTVGGTGTIITIGMVAPGEWIKTELVQGDLESFFGTSAAGPWQPITSIGPGLVSFASVTGGYQQVTPSLAIGDGGPVYLRASGDTTGATDSSNFTGLQNLGFKHIVLQPGLSPGGGHPPAPFYVKTPVQLNISGVAIAGSGVNSVIQPGTAWSASGPLVELGATTVTQCSLSNLTVNGNGNALVTYGVNLDNGAAFSGDGNHNLEGVQSNGCQSSGFQFGYVRGTIARNCQAYNNLGNGFTVTQTDMKLIGCDAGQNAGHNYSILGPNNQVIGCKGWYAGWNGASFSGATSCGLYVDSFFNTIVGNSFQQNALHGIELDSGTYGSTVTGNECDNNSAATANTGSGIYLNAAGLAGRGNTVTGNTGGNNLGLSPGSQLYGIQVNGACLDTMITGNTVTGSSGYFNPVAGASGFFRLDPAYGNWTALPLIAGWTASSPVPSYKLLIGNMVQLTGLATHASFTGNSQIGTVPAALIPSTFQEISGYNQANVPVQIGIANGTGDVFALAAPAGTTAIGFCGAYPTDL